jgi:excisionase family DNA binding protein
MRTLGDWAKYVEKQEVSLKRKSESGIASDPEQSTKPAKPLALPEKPVPLPYREPASADDMVKSAIELRKKRPEQLMLSGIAAGDEDRQKPEKGFKESREELLQRLLDPALSLEDTARVLNVCPATVRRYTNKGILAHFRTPGNQRRFRLSDVLAFMESQAAGAESQTA